MYCIFYKPDTSWAGDIIPYFEHGIFYLYYLNERRIHGIPAEKTTWDLVLTKDFFHFEKKGTVLPTGTETDADRSCYTGSVIAGKDGTYHLYYTAQNSVHPAFMQDGRPLQYIAHATGHDLIHWEKDTGFLMRACPGYEIFDWRDPFVFYLEEQDCYLMLLAARLTDGSLRRSGCLASMESRDLVHWSPGKTFYAPGLYMTHECPDCFQLGDWWYLIFSTFSEKYTTHYCMSRSPEGPWLTPANDTFDGRAFYGAKTAGNVRERFLFGWIPTKAGGNDSGKWEWAGNLAVHQLYQEEDDTLSVRPPRPLLENFCIPFPLYLSGISGSADIPGCALQTNGADGSRDTYQINNADVSRSTLQINGTRRFASTRFPLLPHCCCITGMLSFSSGTISFGLQLHADVSGDCGYFYRLEPLYQRVVFDQWPRSALTEPVIPNHFENDRPFDAGLERPVALQPDQHISFTLLVDSDICVLYLDEKTALTARCCQLHRTHWGFFVHGGQLTVTNLSCMLPEKR